MNALPPFQEQHTKEEHVVLVVIHFWVIIVIQIALMHVQRLGIRVIVLEMQQRHVSVNNVSIIRGCAKMLTHPLIYLTKS